MFMRIYSQFNKNPLNLPVKKTVFVQAAGSSLQICERLNCKRAIFFRDW